MAHYAQFCWARHCDKLSQPSHVVKKINKGKVNEMPAQEGKLTDAQLGVLTAYVWGLSHNKADAAAR